MRPVSYTHLGETDEELRARTLAALAATPASGNADHYAAWCGQVADILRVKVLPLARGNGTVDLSLIHISPLPRSGWTVRASPSCPS